MADTIFDIAALVSDMTEEEEAKIFGGASRRAPNFAQYQMLINALDIGAAKHLDVPKDAPDPRQAARDLKYNLNEAAKERTKWLTVQLTDDEASQYAGNKKIDRFERQVIDAATETDAEGHTQVITRVKDKWVTEVKAPVVLKWRDDTKEVEQTVEKDGKQVTETVKVPTRCHFVIISTEAVRKRAKRTKPADAAAPNGTVVEPLTEGNLAWADALTADEIKELAADAATDEVAAKELALYQRWLAEGAPAPDGDDEDDEGEGEGEGEGEPEKEPAAV